VSNTLLDLCNAGPVQRWRWTCATLDDLCNAGPVQRWMTCATLDDLVFHQ
jgi:hypothetical protein